jgi:hypothetical protein
MTRNWKPRGLASNPRGAGLLSIDIARSYSFRTLKAQTFGLLVKPSSRPPIQLSMLTSHAPALISIPRITLLACATLVALSSGTNYVCDLLGF